MVFLLDESLVFPAPELADEDGLLAIGGDLSTERLALAYSKGIFPWFSEGEPILWYCPPERCVVFPANLKVSKSMKQIFKSNKYRVTWNQAFKEVIQNCSSIVRVGQDGTWITDEMQQAYLALHLQNKAQSVEVWKEDELVGGLYGVVNGPVFCGESMFSKERDTSKLAMMHLCLNEKFKLIDCQIHNDHLQRLGAEMIPYAEFKKYLK